MSPWNGEGAGKQKRETDDTRGMDMNIYALRDPRTQEIRYVGASEDPLRRWREHTFDPQGDKAAWVHELDALGLMPELDILEECVKGDWRELERCYIAVISASQEHRLFNRRT